MKSRQILIEDDCGNLRTTFSCDAADCTKCMLRFQCYTSRSDTIIVTFPLETIEEKISELWAQRWRLRDGSSGFRENRSQRM